MNSYERASNNFITLCTAICRQTIVCILCIRLYVFLYAELAYRSDNFIVGLTNVSPLTVTPTLWNYTLCGQYPGAVPAGATVSLYCQDNLPPFRYVIVQFPLEDDFMNVCEIEVHVRGTKMLCLLPVCNILSWS